MNREHAFRAIIEGGGAGWAYVRIPFDVETAFGKKRVPVRATIDGEEYRGSLMRMGGPEHTLVILKEIQVKIGKEVGDEVEVVLEEDFEPRIIEVPDDLRAALDQDPGAKANFEKLSHSHKKQIVNAMLEAKKMETRNKRIASIVIELRGK
jgi:Domain of unknown function (DUF1905)/Bacteriocin-protection, YdeI or OmpD-Associated